MDLGGTVSLMARIGACYAPTLSPNGDRIAFLSNMSGLPQIWSVPAGGGWPTQVTALDDPIGTVRWSPTGKWLAFSCAPGGGMNAQICVVRPDGTGLKRLSLGGRDNNWLGAWTHDGSAFAVSSNRRRTDAMDIWLVDPETGDWRMIAESRGTGRFCDLSRDGRFAVVHRVANRSDSDLFLIETATGREHRLSPHEGPGSFGGGKFSPDGRTAYLSTNAGRELEAFGRVRLAADGTPGPIEVMSARDDAELEFFELSPDAATALLVWNIAGTNQVEFLDIASGARSEGFDLATEVVTAVTFSPDGRRIAISAMGATSPHNVYLFDRETGELSQLTDAPHAGVVLENLVSPDLVFFPAHDGLDLSGWLYRPHGAEGPTPLVISFHGGPEGQERPILSYNYQALLSQGIAVLAPNVRGSAGFGKTFVNLDNGPLRFDAIRDIKACVDFVVEAGYAQPGQIGIMGGSYGGYMTMVGITEYPDLFAAGANLYGMVNFRTFFQHTEPWMAAISKVEYGDPETQGDLLDALSPIHKLDRVKAATLVLHGANDTNVPVIEAEQIVEHLKRRGVPVEYILFPDEGHGWMKIPNRIRAASAIVNWFVTYLKG